MIDILCLQIDWVWHFCRTGVLSSSYFYSLGSYLWMRSNCDMTSMVYLKQPRLVLSKVSLYTQMPQVSRNAELDRVRGKRCEGWVILQSLLDNPSYATGSILVPLPTLHHPDCICLGLVRNCLPGGAVGGKRLIKVRQDSFLKWKQMSRFSEPSQRCLPSDFQESILQKCPNTCPLIHNNEVNYHTTYKNDKLEAT